MLWWEEGFCRLVARGGRFVIRYDHRDTGRSVTYEPGRPGYTSADLVADAVGVLDAYEVPAAHVAGVSAGGAFAQLLALGHPDRVLSLVLISTSPATPGERGLPSPTERYRRFVASARRGLVGRELGGRVSRGLRARARRGSAPVRRGGDARARPSRRRSVRTTSRPPRTTAWPRRASCRASRCRRSPSPHCVMHGTDGPDVPASAWRGAGPGDPRCTAAHAGGSRTRGRASRLGARRPRDPRAYRRHRPPVGSAALDEEAAR